MTKLRGWTAMRGLIAALVLTCMGGVALADYSDAVMADNPLGYWRLNEAGAAVAENMGSEGDLWEGFYEGGVQGVSGPDALADGTPITGMGAGNVAFEVGPDESYLSVETPILSDLDQFTVSGWFQPFELEGTRIALFGQNDVVEFGLDPAERLNLWTPRGAVGYDYTDTEIAVGAWTHVAAVGRPGSIMELYINGKQVVRTGNEFRIGGGGIWDLISQNNGNQFDGAVDDVAIWDVALTDDQFGAHYDAAVAQGGDYSGAVLADNPMGYWRLNETTGTTAANSGTGGASLDGEYIAGDQGVAGPDLPGMGADNVAYGVFWDGEPQYVDVPASPLSDLAEFSMSGWMQADERLQDRIGLWGQNDVVEFGFINPDVLNVWTPSSSMGDWNIFDEPDLGDKIADGEWVHLAMAGDADGIRLWVDGELVAEGTTPFDGSSGQTFGASEFFFNSGAGVHDDVGNQFTGTLDEIAMWDTALSSEQIRIQFESALGGALTPVLQAGDADQDLDFDQIDLVQVQIAAKYLTGQAANWGEGDWNGAPGGTVGDPPAGNGFFDQLDIIAALGADQYLKGPYFPALAGEGERGDGQTSIVYDPSTGEVAVDAPAGTDLTSINIDSAAGIFVNNEDAQHLDGSFDTHADDNIFKATFGSTFGSLSFGAIASTGLTKEFVIDDLTAIGSLDGGGGLGDVDLVYVPEPTSLLLACLGLLALVGFRRRR